MSMSFKCIWVDCTYRTANLGKLKIVSRGSSHRVYWKRHFTFARRAVLQLLSRSCLLWCAPWPFGSIFEANYIITQKENALISIWLVIFCISWMHWRLQTTCSIIVLLSFFSRSHSEPQMSSKDWKKINAKKKKKIRMTWWNLICLSEEAGEQKSNFFPQYQEGKSWSIGYAICWSETLITTFQCS